MNTTPARVLARTIPPSGVTAPILFHTGAGTAGTAADTVGTAADTAGDMAADTAVTAAGTAADTAGMVAGAVDSLGYA